jgi:hypothetical protein
MRTQSEIKKNNIRKANLLREAKSRKARGNMTSQFGLYEQCMPSGTPLDMEGEYMGAPVGTEPMDMMMGDEMMMGDDMMMMGDDMMMMGDEMDMMMGDEMDMMDDDDMPMSDEMIMMYMNENKGVKPDYLDFDKDGDKKESMKKALKDKKGKMTEKSGCGGKRYNEGNCGGSRRYNEEIHGGGCKDCPGYPSIGITGPPLSNCGFCHDVSTPDGKASAKAAGYHEVAPKKWEKREDYKEIDHSDRSEFDGRKSRVVGVDSDIKKQRELKESYRAVSATPHRDGWGNTFNNILTEGNQVSNINSLMKRMKKVIK